MIKKTIEIYYSPKFIKSHREIPQSICEMFDQKKNVFVLNPFHSSLKTHRLQGYLKSYYSFSINYQYRVMFEFVDTNTVIFVNIGTHEIYK
jgi:mRNA-degrading endonuclease YafQ of YafQ-DinJ toxin-antitoxin module